MTSNDASEAAPAPGRRKKRSWLLGFLFAVFLIWGGLVLGNWFTEKPKGLGAKDGRLANCPDSPNCVCSQEARPSHQISALSYEEDGHAAFSRLAKLLESWPRTRIITHSDTYMHVEFTTRIMRFVDDVEFLLAEDEKVIHVRSASRIGYSDLGANRNRVESIRAVFAKGNGD
jgi:uncharacterized protein (DUF1499 family)